MAEAVAELADAGAKRSRSALVGWTAALVSACHQTSCSSQKRTPLGQPMRRSVPFWIVMLRRTSMIP